MSFSLLHPDPMPLREVLRGLRHGLRRSRKALPSAKDVLPRPAARIAGPVLDGLDTLAGGMDAAVTDLAKRLLGADADRVPPFEVLASDPRCDELFAAAIYGALRGALRRMGDGDAFVSEAAARRAFSEVVSRRVPMPAPAAVAADLGLRLIVAEVVRDIAADRETRVDSARILSVAVVAALLWLMSDRCAADAGSALDAATDIAVVLAGEIASIAAARDRDRLVTLLMDFAEHV